ncbi:MAG: glycosyltransferase family 2 protein [Endozoicomonas sp.]|uniref:glycosyltransferase family 2 protein n=1 Tax=Endozoicomonas sp. TaxID=1892382 RepID=UPI003D9B4579
MKKVDVIIPVFNALDYTKACIESLYEHVSHHINKIIIMDDCSDEETKQYLESLDQPEIELVRNSKNLGYGANVNKGFEFSEKELVLVLNSDTVAENDFLGPLIRSMELSPNLMAVNPMFPFDVDEFRKYESEHNIVKTFMLSGYAFLIRKSAFLNVGGFNPVFGKGYFEDTALGRDLNTENNYTGVCIKSVLHHAGSKSFPTEQRIELEEKNAPIFRNMYPDSTRKVMFLTKDLSLATTGEIGKECYDVCLKGGRVSFFSPEESHLIPNKRFEYRPLRLSRIVSFLNRTVIRGEKRPYTRTSELWVDRRLWKSSANALVARIICALYRVQIRII